jgi:hypothetical protein
MTKVAPSKDELERKKLTVAGILSGYFTRERTDLKRNMAAIKAERAVLHNEAKRLEELQRRLEAEKERIRSGVGQSP